MAGMINQANLEVLKDVAELFEKLVSSLAIIGGSIWAYYKYVRGRIFRHRLEMSISGTYLPGNSHLLLAIELKNIGSSDIPLRQEGTAALVEAIDMAEPKVAGSVFSFKEENTITVTVLEDHEWIESGETIRDQCLVHLRSPAASPLRLKLRVVAKGKTFSKRTAWVATSIVYPSEINYSQSTSVRGESGMCANEKRIISVTEATNQKCEIEANL